MTETLCAVDGCGRPVRDSTVCGACLGQLETALGDVSALATELDVTITRQARIGGGDGGRKSRETPLLFHYRASEDAAVLRNTLASWVRVLMEEAG